MFKKVWEGIKNLKDWGVNLFIKFIDWLINQFRQTDFKINHFISISTFFFLYFKKETIYEDLVQSWEFSITSIDFLYHGLFYFFLFMTLYSGYLIYYVYYIKLNENTLTRSWYRQFLEDEYKIKFEPFLKGVWFFITLVISISALYLSITSMQASFDAVYSTLNWIPDFTNTTQMLGSLWTGIAISIVFFIICFLYFRFTIVNKNIYVRDKYYQSIKISNL